MKKINFTFLILLLVLIFCNPEILTGQSSYYHGPTTVTPDVQFLTFNPNAQSMGFGQISVVSPSIYSESGLFGNPALLSKYQRNVGARISYTPLFRNVIDDMNIIDFGAYGAINRKNSIGINFNYFDWSSITFMDIQGQTIGEYKPKEYYISLKYALSFSKNFSLGIAGKYFSSDLMGGMMIQGIETKKVNSFSIDLGGDYKKNYSLSEKQNLRWDLGFSILNIGPKVSYIKDASSDQKNFIPTSLNIGTMVSYSIAFNPGNKLIFGLGYQAHKLLIPSYPVYAEDSLGNPIVDDNGNKVISDGYDPNVSALKGMFQSFYDSPDGFSGEMKEIDHQFGFEASYLAIQNILVSLRTGLFLQDKSNGWGNYGTLGFGISVFGFYFDYAYILGDETDNSFVKTYCINLGFRTTDITKVFKLNKEDKKE